MKNYMLAEGQAEGEPEDKRRSAAILRDSSVVKNYKKAMKQKKSLRKKNVAAIWTGVAGRCSGDGTGAVLRGTFRAAVSAGGECGGGIPAANGGESDRGEAGATKRQSTAEPEDQTEKAARPGAADNTTENVRDFSDTTDSTTENVRNRSADSSGSTYDDADNDLETGADIFTQEEPDDVTESWSYIGNQYTVQRGDTLAGISMKIYQSYELYRCAGAGKPD